MKANLHCEQREADRAKVLRPRTRRDRVEDHPARQRLRKAIDTFFEVFNGGFEADAGLPAHFCNGPRCCATDADCQAKMSAALLSLPLRHAPTPPSSSKWTKTGPSVDYYLLANTCMLLSHLLIFSMKPFKMEDLHWELDAPT